LSITMGKNTRSGSMKGEKFWKQEEGNVGMKLMKGMGWEGQGSGLGKNDSGQHEALRVTMKADRTGIGATDTSDGMYYSAMNDVFNNLLTKLNKKKEEKEEGGEPGEPEEATQSMASSIEKAASKRRLYSKFVKAKDVGGYSDQQKAAIFGTAGKKEEKVVEEDSDDEANTTTTAKVSMADYFKQKMAGVAAATPRRSPRLTAAASPQMMGMGMGMGFNQGAEEEGVKEDAEEDKKEAKRKREKEDSASKPKASKPNATKATKKMVKKLLKAAGKSMKMKKLEKAFVAEFVESEMGSKKEAKAAFAEAVEALTEVTVEDGVATLCK